MRFMLAAFLFRHGRRDEGKHFAERSLQSARKLGANSPVIEFVERRIAAVVATASGSPD